MALIYMSAEDAARDFAALLAQVRAGAEVVIQDAASPAVLLRAVASPRGRLVSESIALAETHARELAEEPTMDDDFAADLEAILSKRRPRSFSEWD